MNKKIKAKLISHTINPEKVVAIAARVCYSKKSYEKLEKNFTQDNIEQMIRKVKEMEHYSVFEHASFTFFITGISRACSHQLVRHRIASYSQQSQRYIEFSKRMNYSVPNDIEKNPELAEKFAKMMDDSFDNYRYLIENGIKPEDARAVLPNASVSNMVFTMNARELFHFFKLRLCLRAQLEIRQMTIQMLSELKKVAPIIFENVGPSCRMSGFCKEKDQECPNYIKYIK